MLDPYVRRVLEDTSIAPYPRGQQRVVVAVIEPERQTVGMG